MKILALTLLFLFLPGISYSIESSPSPIINNVSGAFNHGNYISITGSAFGTKSPAKPLVWADFESGNITGNSTLSSNPDSFISKSINIESSVLPHFNSTRSVRGQSIVSGVKVSSKVGAYLGDADKYYAFIRRRDPAGSFSKLANAKYWWAWPGPENASYIDTRVQYHNFSCPYVASSGQADIQLTYGTPNSVSAIYNMVSLENQWVISEIQDSKGDLNKPNSTIKWWINGSLKANGTTVNRSTAYPGGYRQIESSTYFSAFKCPDGTLTGTPTDSAKYYWDDLYFDATWARVMIGNASTFDACTHREPLIPTAWSSTSITAYFNQGAFSNGSKVYVFVIDSNGNSSTGKAITIGGTASGGDASIPGLNPNPPVILNIK